MSSFDDASAAATSDDHHPRALPAGHKTWTAVRTDEGGPAAAGTQGGSSSLGGATGLGDAGGNHTAAPASLFDLIQGVITPKVKFVMGDAGERERLYKAASPREQDDMLGGVSPGEARAIVLGEDPAAQAGTIARYTKAHGDALLRGMHPGELASMFASDGGKGQVDLFRHLSRAQQIGTFRLLPADQMDGFLQAADYELYPALFSAIDPSEIGAIMSRVDREHAGQIVRGLPPHLVDMIRPDLARFPDLVDNLGEVGEGDEQVAAYEAQQAEEAADAPAPHRRNGKATSDWAAMGRGERADAFEKVDPKRRGQYLKAEPDSRIKMLRSLDDPAERATTLAEYLRGGGKDSLAQSLTPDELIDAVLQTPDPKAIGDIVGSLRPNQLAELAPVLTPQQIAAAVAQSPDKDKTWQIIRGAVPDASLSAALRRMDPDSIDQLGERLDAESEQTMRGLVPAPRQAAADATSPN